MTLAILCIMLSAGCGGVAQGNTNDIRGLVASAEQAKGAHLDQDCIRLYGQALAVQPELVSAYVGRADCYLDEGKPDAAVHDYTEALRRSPNDPAIYISRGAAFRVLGNNSSAKEDFQRGALFSSSNPGQIVNAAVGLGQMGFYRDAIAVLDDGIKRYGSAWSLYRYRGEVSGILGNDKDALKDFDSAIRLATGGDLAFVLATRADFFSKRQEYSLAIADYGRAIQIVPDQYWLFEGRAQVRLASNDLRGAEADFTKAISSQRATTVPAQQALAGLYEERGKVFLQEGARDKAAADFRSALAIVQASDTTSQARLKQLLATAGG